ncbi:LLM class F420-dependent oxidoreductase [Umezawaea endophytica]|uniref:LLM class F420-dependent oxidoreductase n=1 Tax=Umezawaea endophytica TaxID=1654476 RepID=A0A9X2VRV4_9PSEU|nr:LLM class F420-dependent oxidoreductase [Umezawaea endophytica]MCS7481504.1 LLM class F420-dependent oxidoreductase [Umezawaea endophytica]
MDFGVFGLSAKAATGPHATTRLARHVERLGYTSWWVGEHVVLPTNHESPPMAPTDPILDPLVHLAFVAAVAERLELGTGIVILPQRNPLVLAKQAASLDVLSGGRLHLGVASGYLEPEMTAVGVPMADRGRRTDEYIDAMTALWHAEKPEYHGKYVDFADVDAFPRPVGGPRILIGGHSPAAFRRAVARGHGWIGNGSSPADLSVHLEGLAKAATEVERPAALGPLEITFMPVDPVEVTEDDAKRYRDLGVDRLLIYPLPLEDLDDISALLERQVEVLHRVRP